MPSHHGPARRRGIHLPLLVATILGALMLGAAPASAAEAPTVRIRVSTQEAAAGVPVRIGGRVLGAAAAHGRVVLQKKRANGSWRRIAVKRTGDRSGYRFRVTPRQGRHVYRVKARRHAGQRAAVSAKRRIRVIAAEQRSGGSTTSVDDALSTVRQLVLEQTNQARVARGLPRLRAKSGIDRVAQSWTADMAATGELSHNPSYADQMPAGWTRAGENVATGYAIDAVVDAWMDSPGHRANILGDYTHLGVGFVRDARGRTWYTQNFGRY